MQLEWQELWGRPVVQQCPYSKDLHRLLGSLQVQGAPNVFLRP